MKIAFCTHVSDDWYIPVGAQKLEQSSKYFHPEIPFFTFKSDVINEAFAQDPRANWCTIHPVMASRLADDYDLVVHFDADSIIVGRLDAVIAGDYEVAGVRNNNDFGHAGADVGITYQEIGIWEFLNAGLVAVTNKQFWFDWNELTHSKPYPYQENGSLNVLFYSGKYKAKMLDPLGSPAYYGIACNSGDRPAQHYESWKELQVRNEELYLNNKQVKVLHQAGAGTNNRNRFHPSLFNEETLVFLEKITGQKWVH